MLTAVPVDMIDGQVLSGSATGAYGPVVRENLFSQVCVVSARAGQADFAVLPLPSAALLAAGIQMCLVILPHLG